MLKTFLSPLNTIHHFIYYFNIHRVLNFIAASESLLHFFFFYNFSYKSIYARYNDMNAI